MECRVAPATQTTFDTCRHVRISPRALPATEKRHGNLLGNLRKGTVLQRPPVKHGDATRKPDNRDWTCRSLKKSILWETSSIFMFCSRAPNWKSTFSGEFSHEPLNLLPQNQCFVRGFRQFSAHLRKCHTTESAPCRRLTQPCQCDSQKHATRHV